MITLKDLEEINYIPEETDISLELMLSYFENVLAKKIYIFTLEDNTKIKLMFNNSNEIYHLSGIEHIYESDKTMNNDRFVELIRNGNISLSDLKKQNPNGYLDFIERITSFFCIEHIIKGCDYLFFSKGIIPDSKIKVKYLLLKDVSGKNLHLGINTYKINRPYYACTLLVTERNNLEKYKNKADQELKVNCIEVINKSDDKVLMNLKKKEAEEITINKINDLVEFWIKNKAEEDILKNIELNTDSIWRKKNWNKFIETNNQFIECLNLKIKENGKFFDIYKEITDSITDEDKTFWIEEARKVYDEYSTKEVYEDILNNLILPNNLDEAKKQVEKSLSVYKRYAGWKNLEDFCNNRKQEIISEVSLLDSYNCNYFFEANLQKRIQKYKDDEVKNIIELQLKNNLPKLVEHKFKKINDEELNDFWNRLFDVILTKINHNK